MKLLYIVSTLARTGPTIQLLNIVRHLDRTAFQPVILTLSPEAADSLLAEFEAEKVDVRSLSLSRLAGALKGRRAVAKLLGEISPNLIHTQGIRADTIIAGLRPSVPCIATAHNFPQFDYPMSFGRVRGRLMCRAHIRAFRELDAVVSVSGAVKESLRAEFGLDNVHAVPNGVEMARFKCPDQTEKLALRRRLQLPADAEIWISTGHLSALKNPSLLIEAWHAMRLGRKNVWLALLGDGPLLDKCRALASAGEGIVIPGRVPNVADYLGAADFYISASRAEGLPNAVLEGLACGLPAVLSDIPPHREIVGITPEAAFLFAVDDKDALIHAIEEMRRGNCKAMSAVVRAAAEKHFGAEVMSGRYQQLYRQLAVAARSG